MADMEYQVRNGLLFAEPLFFMTRQKYSVLYFVLLSVLAALCATLFLDKDGFRRVMDEWGPIEFAGILFYTVLIAVLILYSRENRPFFIHTAIVLAIMTARELDFQISFSSKNILNKNFYRQGIGHEQIGALIVLGILLVIVLAYLRYLPAWMARLRRGAPCAFSILVAIVSIPVSILVDGAPRVLHKEMGLPMSMGLKHFCTAFEESLEMCIPLMMLWAFLQYRAWKKAATPT